MVLPPGTPPVAVAALVTAAVSSGVVRALSVHDPSGGLLASGGGRRRGGGGGGVAAAIAAVRQRLPPTVRRRVRVGGWGATTGPRVAAGAAAAAGGGGTAAASAATAVLLDGADGAADADGDGAGGGPPAGADVPLRPLPRLPVTLVVGVDGREGIAAAARALAATPPAARAVDGVGRPPTAASVGAWLDRGAAAAAAAALEVGGGGAAAAAAAASATPWALPGGEPDVVVLFRGPGMLPCLGGFPPWQLRLALLWVPPRRGWLGRREARVADLGVAGVTAAVAAARGASRRFGS